MLLGGNDACNGEGRKQLGLVLEAFNLEPDHGEFFRELFHGLVGVEMLLQPGEGEFHGWRLPVAPPPPLRGRSVREADREGGMGCASTSRMLLNTDSQWRSASEFQNRTTR